MELGCKRHVLNTLCVCVVLSREIRDILTRFPLLLGPVSTACSLTVRTFINLTLFPAQLCQRMPLSLCQIAKHLGWISQQHRLLERKQSLCVSREAWPWHFWWECWTWLSLEKSSGPAFCLQTCEFRIFYDRWAGKAQVYMALLVLVALTVRPYSLLRSCSVYLL